MHMRRIYIYNIAYIYNTSNLTLHDYIITEERRFNKFLHYF